MVANFLSADFADKRRFFTFLSAEICVICGFLLFLLNFLRVDWRPFAIVKKEPLMDTKGREFFIRSFAQISADFLIFHLRILSPFPLIRARIYFRHGFFALTRAYDSCIFICMRTTLNIDDQIMSQASRLTGVGEKTKLVHMGLRSIIEQESARRLAKLGGTEPGLKPGPRRRSS